MKKYLEEKKEIKQKNDFIYDSEGRVLITIKAETEDKLLSSYDYDGGEKLNPEAEDYILEKTRFMPKSKDLKIKIFTSKEVDAEKVKKAIKANYKKAYNVADQQRKRKLVFSLIMTLCGVAALALLLSTVAFFKNEYVSVILDVVVWVFIWEAVDSFFFERAELKLKQSIYLKIYSGDIEIVQLDELGKKGE